MAATDARPVPRKNTAYRFYFAIRKPSDATLITTWAGQDSEVSLDGAGYNDCTAEATEIGTTGTGYIDLTAAEMNADAVMLKVTVTNTGAVPLVFTLYPEEAGDYRVDPAAIRSALGLAIANLDTQLADLPTNAEIATALGAADDAVLAAVAALVATVGAAGAGLNSIPWNAAWDAEVQSEVTNALLASLVEGYRGVGATGSVRDFLYELSGHMGRTAIVGTDKTVFKIDGTTPAKVYELNSAVPSSIAETT